MKREEVTEKDLTWSDISGDTCNFTMLKRKAKESGVSLWTAWAS